MNIKNFKTLTLAFCIALLLTACSTTASENSTEDNTITNTSETTSSSETTETTGSAKSSNNESTDNSIEAVDLYSILKNRDNSLVVLNTKTVHYGNYPLTHIDHDTFFLKDGEEQESSGRYADVSSDGKINWQNPEPQTFDSTVIAVEMVEKLTLNGNKIKLPMTFKDLGEDFASFDNVDFTKVTKDMFPLLIRDTNTGYNLYLDTDNTANMDANNLIVSISDSEFNFISSLSLDLNTGLIMGILTSSATFGEDLNDSTTIVSPFDLKVDGFGAGKTVNEFYEKFGLPKGVARIGGDMPIMGYQYVDENTGLQYIVIINYFDEIYDSVSKSKRKVRNNTVTNISVTVK